MIEPSLMTELTACYPILTQLPDRATREIRETAVPLAAPAGSVLFDEGDRCRAFPLLTAGRVRVERHSERGRRLMLYTVKPGDSCILTVSALLGDAPYQAVGIADSPLRGAAMPEALFRTLITSTEPFRSFVFRYFADRITRMMLLIENLAWQNVRQRLAGLLAAGPGSVRESHQDLADRLGTVREVVSRTLKQFEAAGLVSLGREQIDVLDPDGLKEIAYS